MGRYRTRVDVYMTPERQAAFEAIKGKTVVLEREDPETGDVSLETYQVGDSIKAFMRDAFDLLVEKVATSR
jgi:hypothetical protein